MTKLKEMSNSSDGGELSAFLGSGAMMRRYACLAAALVAVSAQAFNWSDYSEGADVLVTANATATDSDMATINSYSMLRFASGTTITFDISGDASLTCPVAATGTIVKCGTGSLTIATSSQHGSGYAFRYVDFEVEEGVLKAPQENATGPEFWTRKVIVGENGTFFTTRSRNTCIDGGLWGSGVITNIASDGSAQLRVMNVSSTPCVFSGRILGKGIRWYSGGNVHLTGTNSLFSGSFQLWNGNGDVAKRGTTGVVKIGNAGEPCSVGSSVSTLASREMGARYLYLGKGETTSRGYSYYNNQSGSTSMHYWDAGAHGGVTFTGTWIHGNSQSERLVLMGSNTAPCVIAGPWTGDNATNATYVIKRGSGTWRLAHNSNRTLSGVIAVEDGTLEFESIAETNENCSLGRATCLQSSYTGKYNASKNVDYAYLLGTTSTTGTMSFVGTSDSVSQSRPFAVQGRGRVRNAGLGGQLGLGGAFAATAAGGTLVLDAADGTMNAFSMVRDGDHGGVLSLEKTGAGTWALEGTNTFSGAIAVNEGTLIVRNRPYSWFKFTVMETNGGRKKRLGTSTSTSDSNTEIQEFALYSSDGVRRNVGMTFHTTYDDWTALPIGHACWARGGTINYYNNRNGDKMFDDEKTGTGCCILFNNSFVRIDTPSTWIPVLMHMDPDEERITAFDFNSLQGNTADRTPIAYKMEVSRDGYNWTQVHYETNSPAASWGNWYSDPSEAFVTGAVRPGKGFSVSNETFAADEMLPNVSDVSVASNAVIVAEGPVPLKTLSVDASGAGNGTVKGFSFAEVGTLRIEGLGALAGKCEIPMALEDCTGLENVSKWSLMVNGEAGDRYRAKARADGIVVTAAGTLVIMK